MFYPDLLTWFISPHHLAAVGAATNGPLQFSLEDCLGIWDLPHLEFQGPMTKKFEDSIFMPQGRIGSVVHFLSRAPCKIKLDLDFA